MGFSRQHQRVLWSNNGTIVDLTAELNEYRANTYTIPFVSAEDYLYIGSDLPFNNKYIDVSTANDQAAAITLAYWWSNGWQTAVDVIDETASSGVALAQDGLLSFSPDEFDGWDREQDSADVTGLAGTKIYDMYWLRLHWDADWNAATALNYIGHRFCNDTDLYSRYAMLRPSGLRTAWESGKTDWSEQQYVASEEIVKDLKRARVLWSPAQLMDTEILRDACIHKTAEIIFNGLGTAYIDMKREAASAYKKAIDIGQFKVDKNADAKAEPWERYDRAGRLNR